MILSVFLAKLLGLYFIIISLVWIFRHRQVMMAAKEIAHSKALQAVSAEFSLVFGLVIALDHPMWAWDWTGLVTVLGYLFILRGILRFAYPEVVQRYFTKMQKDGAWTVFVILLILGAYLAYCGFAFHPDVMTGAS